MFPCPLIVTLSLILFCEWTALCAGAGQTAQQFTTTAVLDQRTVPAVKVKKLGSRELGKSKLGGCPKAEALTGAPLSPNQCPLLSSLIVLITHMVFLLPRAGVVVGGVGNGEGLHFYDFITLSLEMLETAFRPQVALCGYELHLITAPSI